MGFACEHSPAQKLDAGVFEEPHFSQTAFPAQVLWNVGGYRCKQNTEHWNGHRRKFKIWASHFQLRQPAQTISSRVLSAKCISDGGSAKPNNATPQQSGLLGVGFPVSASRRQIHYCFDGQVASQVTPGYFVAAQPPGISPESVGKLWLIVESQHESLANKDMKKPTQNHRSHRCHTAVQSSTRVRSVDLTETFEDPSKSERTPSPKLRKAPDPGCHSQ